MVKSTHLQFLSQVLPSYFVAGVCAMSRCRLSEARDPKDKLSAETVYLQSLRDVYTTNSSRNMDTSNPLIAKLSAFKEVQMTFVKQLCVQSFTELDTLVEQIKSKLIDHKPLLKEFAAHLDAFMNFEGRQDLLSALKEINGVSGGGLCRFGNIKSTLESADIAEVNDRKLVQVRADIVKVRQQGRLQVSLRSAANILNSGNAAAVPSFYKEAATLKVALPTCVKTLLDQLQESER